MQDTEQVDLDRRSAGAVVAGNVVQQAPHRAGLDVHER
jgi:hypothetical protein